MAPSEQTPDLDTYLQTLLSSGSRKSLSKSVLPTLLQSIATIANALHSASTVSQVGTANAFGDEQLNVDVIAEDIIREALRQCESVVTASSEEDPVERKVHENEKSANANGEKYTVAFDPLDGSSIIAPNWTVGTIIGIWDGETAIGVNPEKQVAAIMGVYGPRTTAVVALRVPGETPTCFEVSITSDNSTSNTQKIQITRSDIQLLPPDRVTTRYFAPANLRAAAEDQRYLSLINTYISQKYTLRYSGGLVPDIYHALVKGHGIYVSPVTQQSKAKLRMVFELMPIALIVECCGGVAVDSKDGKRILEGSVKDIDQRGGLVCGTREEVEGVVRQLC